MAGNMPFPFPPKGGNAAPNPADKKKKGKQDAIARRLEMMKGKKK